MKKISLFLVALLIISFYGCTFASQKEESSIQLSVEEIMAYTSLIKTRIESKSFLRYYMKSEAYNSIRTYVYNLLKNTKSEERPCLIMFDKFSKKQTDEFFQICIVFEELSSQDIVEEYITNNNNFYTEYIIMVDEEFEENSVLQQFETLKDNVIFLKRQFEGTDDTYLTIQITR